MKRLCSYWYVLVLIAGTMLIDHQIESLHRPWTIVLFTMFLAYWTAFGAWMIINDLLAEWQERTKTKGGA